MIKRYDMENIGNREDNFQMVEDIDGQYVKYEDHAAEVNRIIAERKTTQPETPAIRQLAQRIQDELPMFLQKPDKSSASRMEAITTAAYWAALAAHLSKAVLDSSHAALLPEGNKP
jgi:hypothetical protein